MKRLNYALLEIKGQAQRSHVKNRFLERFGYDLAEKYTHICLAIRAGAKSVSCISPRKGHTSFWETELIPEDVIFVFDHETQEIATVLTRGMWQSRVACNSPQGKDKSALKTSIADTPAGKELQRLKNECSKS